MKYSFKCKLFYKVYSSLIKENIDKKALKKEYKAIILRAKDIGDDNMLLGSYALAAIFISLNRVNPVNPEQNYKIVENGLRNAKGIVRAGLGNAKGYFSEKRMAERRAWSKKTYERKYENDWIVDVIESDGNFKFGLDYKECGVVKLCKDEGVPELAKYLCKLDFLLVDLIGIKLDRTKTLANGDNLCDFRFSEKE